MILHEPLVGMEDRVKILVCNINLLSVCKIKNCGPHSQVKIFIMDFLLLILSLYLILEISCFAGFLAASRYV